MSHQTPNTQNFHKSKKEVNKTIYMVKTIIRNQKPKFHIMKNNANLTMIKMIKSQLMIVIPAQETLILTHKIVFISQMNRFNKKSEITTLIQAVLERFSLIDKG